MIINDFLSKHGFGSKDIMAEAEKMSAVMQRGLEVKQDVLPMIPAYLANGSNIADGESAVIIDAGGTNFRTALVTFNGGKYSVDGMLKCKMPGAAAPATWEEFISFIADKIQPLLANTNKIGFCFSYNAEITPEIDAKVVKIDKEITITGCEGKMVGEALVKELESRGIFGKRVVILNDTIAVLMGGSSTLNKSLYDGFIGEVSGTGMNVCCELPLNRIKKLGIDSSEKILVNMEAGTYNGMEGGDIDKKIDKESKDPGNKILEKQCSGAYIGEICRMALVAGANEGLFSDTSNESILKMTRFDGSVANDIAVGNNPGNVFANEEDNATAAAICKAIFERSAESMAITHLAIMLLTGEGKEKPVCIIAEGSLVQHSKYFAPKLTELLDEYTAKLGRKYEFIVEDGSTVPGSAAAAILN